MSTAPASAVPASQLERIVQEGAGAGTLREQAEFVDIHPLTAALSDEMRAACAEQWRAAADALEDAAKLAQAELDRRRAASTAARRGISLVLNGFGELR